MKRNFKDMKILVLGAKGNLGSQLVEVFSRKKNDMVIAWSRNECDVTDVGSLFSKIKQLMPDVIINTVAYNNVDGCENKIKEQEKAVNLNVTLVDRLAIISLEIGCKLIHFSTNYVFSGESPSYNEEAEPSPINFYGLTKAMGEKVISNRLEDGLDACIIRVSNLFGKKALSDSSKPCFFDIMLNRSKMSDYLNVIDDEYNCFTYTKDVANMIADMVDKKDFNGIYHVVNSNSVSWYEAACYYFSFCGIDVDIRPINSSKFNRVAKRPKTAILKANRCLYLRDFKEALKDYCQECNL